MTLQEKAVTIRVTSRIALCLAVGFSIATALIVALLFVSWVFSEAEAKAAPTGSTGEPLRVVKPCSTASAQKWNRWRVREIRADGHSRPKRARPVCIKTYRKFKAHVIKVERDRKLLTNVPYAIRRAFTDVGIKWQATNALRVAYCESTYNRFAFNGSHWGLFQLSASHVAAMTKGEWSNAYANAHRAAVIVKGDGGWGQWVCKP